MGKKFKISFILAGILASLSWIIAVYYWDKLPATIPRHFGISGMIDGWADKSIFQVFLLPFIQFLMLALFIFIYYKPQYSNIPGTMWLVALDDKAKNNAYNMIRIMNSGVMIFVSFIFSYIVYAMNESAINGNSAISNLLMFVIICLLLIWIVFWSIMVYRVTKNL